MLGTNGSATVVAAVGCCINVLTNLLGAWSSRVGTAIVLRGAWHAAGEPQVIQHVRILLWKPFSLAICFQFCIPFYWFTELRRGVLLQSTPQNEMSKIRTDVRRLTAGYICLKTKSVVKRDRLINIMNIFVELLLDLRAVNVVCGVSAKKSNASAKCST